MIFNYSIVMYTLDNKIYNDMTYDSNVRGRDTVYSMEWHFRLFAIGTL